MTKAELEVLIAPYQKKIDSHSSNWINIQLSRISGDKSIPENVKWAWWTLNVQYSNKKIATVK